MSKFSDPLSYPTVSMIPLAPLSEIDPDQKEKNEEENINVLETYEPQSQAENREPSLASNLKMEQMEELSRMTSIYNLIDTNDTHSLSFAKTLFTLNILTIGVSNLNMPYWIQYTGIIAGIFLLILGAIISLWSYYLIKNLFLKYKVSSYEQLVQMIYGNKMKIFLTITLEFYIFGVILVYQVVIYKLIGGVINIIGKYNYESVNDFLEKSFWKKRKWKFLVNFSICIVILIPLSLFKSNKILGNTSMLGVLSITLLILIIIIQCPFYYNDYKKNHYDKSLPETHLNVYDISKSLTSNCIILQSFVTFAFNYSFHTGVFSTLSKLKEKNGKNIKKLIDMSIILLLLTYILATICGYLTQPYDVPDLIIERRTLWKNDVVMMIGWFTMIICGITKIPTNFYNLRTSFFAALGQDVSEIRNWKNVLFTLSVLLTTTLIASVYQEVSDYISLISSFCFVIFSFLIPTLCYYKGIIGYKNKWSRRNVANFIVAFLASSMGIVSGSFTIKGMIDKRK